MKIQALEREKIFQQFLKEKEMIDEVTRTPSFSLKRRCRTTNHRL